MDIQANFVGRANLSRPLILLDLLEMGIPTDVVKALVDDLEITSIPRHEKQDVGVEVQHMVVAALSSLHSIGSDVNDMSATIDDVNRRQSHFESELGAVGRIAVDCGDLNTQLILIATYKMSETGARQIYLSIMKDVCQEVNRSI